MHSPLLAMRAVTPVHCTPRGSGFHGGRFAALGRVFADAPPPGASAATFSHVDRHRRHQLDILTAGTDDVPCLAGKLWQLRVSWRLEALRRARCSDGGGIQAGCRHIVISGVQLPLFDCVTGACAVQLSHAQLPSARTLSGCAHSAAANCGPAAAVLRAGPAWLDPAARAR